MTTKYNDIIHLPHHVSATRPHMSVSNRAAQFSPFAALTGHGAAVKETARLTDERIELDESIKDDLSHRMQIVLDNIKEQPEISITYFKPDTKKNGGAYVTSICSVKKIDEHGRFVIMNDCTIIPIDDIINIGGEIFETIIFYSCYE